jgi:hypothetical protein
VKIHPIDVRGVHIDMVATDHVAPVQYNVRAGDVCLVKMRFKDGYTSVPESLTQIIM